MSSTHHDEVNRLRPSELSFDTLCSLFEALLKVKGHDKRAKLVRHFMDTCILRKSPNGKGEAYDVFRLILPFLDTERGNYQLKESKLAVAFIEAASIDRRSKEAQAAKHWTNPGQKKDAGNFAEVLQESLFRKNCSVQDTSSIELRKQVTIGDVNAKLDELVAAAGDTKKQAGILRYFMRRCTPTHMKWLTKIILKHLNINISEGRIFKLWHTDALEVFNNSGMSLRKVFNEMTDEDKPWSCDISPGNAVRPQLARAVMSPAAGFKLMSQSEYRNADGQLEFLVESKFDGERIQIHRCKGGKTCYFSRVALDHSVHSSYSVMDGAVGAAAPGHEEFILDGELVVWNKRR